MKDINLDSTVSNFRSVSRKNYILPQAKCILFKGNLSFSGVAVWNSSPVNINGSPSLERFCEKLYSVNNTLIVYC